MTGIRKEVEARESAGCRNWNSRVFLIEGSATGARSFDILIGCGLVQQPRNQATKMAKASGWCPLFSDGRVAQAELCTGMAKERRWREMTNVQGPRKFQLGIVVGNGCSGVVSAGWSFLACCG
jgi:hypothetical protein